MNTYILAIDQGTTSTRAILFRPDTSIAATAQREFKQHFPVAGWVEHEPEDIWDSTLAVCREVLARVDARAADIAAIGITNQRETTIVWDRATGQPIHRAIVWQDRRTAELCAPRSRRRVTRREVAARTGLRIDPYFSATKIGWILDHGARRPFPRRARRARLRHGRYRSCCGA